MQDFGGLIGLDMLDGVNLPALKVREGGNPVVEQNERFNDFMAHELGGPLSNRAGRQQEHETIVRN